MNTDKMIFVFGSNLRGVHGAGAAKFALEQRGAVWGVGWGRQGQSFAVPTKDRNIETLPLDRIEHWVKQFMHQAEHNYAQMRFQVTCLGCGLAGLKHEDIAPMFVNAPDNCYFDTLWQPWLGDSKQYWGTF